MATMRYPVGLRKEAASYQWRTDLCGCCGYRNPLTGEMVRRRLVGARLNLAFIAPLKHV